MNQAPVVFCTREYRYFADALCERGGFEQGAVEERLFPDGERYLRIGTRVAGRTAVVVAGTISDRATLVLYDLASALVKYGAERLILVVPYFGYSTMERAVRTGEVVTAKTRARLLSAIPIASKGNCAYLLDLHSEGLVHYFEGGLTAFQVSSAPLLLDQMRKLGGDDFVVGSTDAGRAKWVEAFARDLAVDAAFVYKRRVDARSTEVAAVSAHVTGRRVVVYDDMIRTGGSLLNAARAYLDAGARELFAVATHGVLPEDAFAKIRDSGLFRRVVCTDSHPRAKELESAGLEVIQATAPFVEAIVESAE